MLYPSRLLKSSLFFSSHLAMLVISTSIMVVACGEVRLLRTMCSAIARRIRLGVTNSSSAPIVVDTGSTLATTGSGIGVARVAGVVGVVGVDAGAVATGWGGV